MKGFFTEKQTQSVNVHKGKILSCTACGLFKQAETPKMKPTGDFEKGIMIIGEAPGELDDQRASHFNDAQGRLLKRVLREIGIDLKRDCISLNAINCHQGNRVPSIHEINCCRRIVLREIDKYMPKVIICLGKSATTTLIGHRWKEGISKMEQWRGWQIPDQDLKAWICPTLDLYEVERAGPEVKLIFQQDMEKAVKMTTIPFAKKKPFTINVIDDLTVLYDLQSTMVAIDYETTGIKPHAPGHRIVSASVSPDPDSAYVFMMPETKAKRKPFTDLLSNFSIAKTAQNMKFEDAWSYFRLKTQVQGWMFDTMLATHLLDNRDRITGLKFQTYVNFGVVDYNSDVDSYLRASGNDGNDFNRILDLIKTEEGKQALLQYNALDTIYEYRLALLQIDKLNYSFLPF